MRIHLYLKYSYKQFNVIVKKTASYSSIGKALLDCQENGKK